MVYVYMCLSYIHFQFVSVPACDHSHLSPHLWAWLGIPSLLARALWHLTLHPYCPLIGHQERDLMQKQLHTRPILDSCYFLFSILIYDMKSCRVVEACVFDPDTRILPYLVIPVYEIAVAAVGWKKFVKRVACDRALAAIISFCSIVSKQVSVAALSCVIGLRRWGAHISPLHFMVWLWRTWAAQAYWSPAMVAIVRRFLGCLYCMLFAQASVLALPLEYCKKSCIHFICPHYCEDVPVPGDCLAETHICMCTNDTRDRTSAEDIRNRSDERKLVLPSEVWCVHLHTHPQSDSLPRQKSFSSPTLLCLLRQVLIPPPAWALF